MVGIILWMAMRIFSLGFSATFFRETSSAFCFLFVFWIKNSELVFKLSSPSPG